MEMSKNVKSPVVNPGNLAALAALGMATGWVSGRDDFGRNPVMRGSFGKHKTMSPKAYAVRKARLKMAKASRRANRG